MFEKIGIIGGGNIGGVLLQECVMRKLAKKVALVDVKEPDMAKGKCLDIAEALPVIQNDTILLGSKTGEVLEGADMIINTAGVPRVVNPDGSVMSREDLLAINLKITDSVSENIKKYCPEAFIISIANPLDAIVYRLNQNLSPKKGKLIGMAGVLDSARYSYFIAEKAGVSVENVTSMVLGGHGDTMVPVRSHCRIAGIPVESFIESNDLDAIEDRVRNAGKEVVNLLGSGSAFVSPAWSALEMAEAILYDKKKILPCSVLLEGEYGYEGVFVGVPVMLGKNGVEKVVEIELNEKEKELLGNSVEKVKETIGGIES